MLLNRETLTYAQIVKEQLVSYIDQGLCHEQVDQAAKLIIGREKSGGRVHVCGIGKPAHVASYTAALLSSIGTPSYYIDATEAVHGSSGQCRKGDVVICISNSGTTEELLRAVFTFRRNGCKIIAVSGQVHCKLAEMAEVSLFAGVKREGGPLNRAPRASVLAEMIVLQELSICLQAHKALSVEQYVRYHPAGALGVIDREADMKDKR